MVQKYQSDQNTPKVDALNKAGDCIVKVSCEGGKLRCGEGCQKGLGDDGEQVARLLTHL